MIKVYEVVSNYYLAGKNGEATSVRMPTRYHGVFLIKRKAIKKLNKIIEELESTDMHKRFQGAHDHMAIFPLDKDGFVIDCWPEDKDKLHAWVRYHISVMDLTDNKYLEELQ